MANKQKIFTFRINYVINCKPRGKVKNKWHQAASSLLKILHSLFPDYCLTLKREHFVPLKHKHDCMQISVIQAEPSCFYSASSCYEMPPKVMKDVVLDAQKEAGKFCELKLAYMLTEEKHGHNTIHPMLTGQIIPNMFYQIKITCKKGSI